ncbi:hypothetical protein BSKO_08719 [Bryopsis sp. KO-2023]|nr:hypothetical protein BSKO_08719 [Bryopsis sp. KO-2023]
MLWKSVGRLNTAFVLLNRYLDLVEAMEEGDGTVLENADFVDTDIPYDFELPEKDYVPEDQREEVRDWVLIISMDQQPVDQTLSTRPCDRCGSDIYEASLVCQNCKAKKLPARATLEWWPPLMIGTHGSQNSRPVQSLRRHKRSN